MRPRTTPQIAARPGLSAFAIVVGFGACGSSSHSSSPTTAASPSPNSSAAPASSNGSSPAGTPIKVGEICSCTGAPGFSQYEPPEQDSVKAWADAVNAAGGIDGHPVQVIATNDQSNPGNSATDAQQLISDHVVALVDDTNFVPVWAQAAETAKVPVVGTNEINAQFDTSADFFAEGQTNATTLQAVVAVAKQAGGGKLAYFYCAESVICSQSVPLLKTAAKAAGIDYVYSSSISATSPSFSAQCLAAKQAGATEIFIADAGTVLENVASSCATQGFNPAYISEGAGFTMSEATSTLGKNLWSQYADAPFWDSAIPSVKAYDTAMDRYFPGVIENKPIMNQDGFQAWVSGKLIEAGLRASGLTPSTDATASSLTRGLDSLKNETLGGLAPPLSFTAGKPNSQNCYFIAHVVNGQPQLVNGGKPSCVTG